MRYDRGYGRQQPPRGYDFGLRGYGDTVPEARPVRMRPSRGGDGYDRPYHGRPAFPNRVTQRYNMDYVRPQPNRLRTNYTPFGGDFDQRVVDATGQWRPYVTQGGSRTWRGGGQPIGWEREADYGRYDREFRGYGRDFYGPMR